MASAHRSEAPCGKLRFIGRKWSQGGTPRPWTVGSRPRPHGPRKAGFYCQVLEGESFGFSGPSYVSSGSVTVPSLTPTHSPPLHTHRFEGGWRDERDQTQGDTRVYAEPLHPSLDSPQRSLIDVQGGQPGTPHGGQLRLTLAQPLAGCGGHNLLQPLLRCLGDCQELWDRRECFLHHRLALPPRAGGNPRLEGVWLLSRGLSSAQARFSFLLA